MDIKLTRLQEMLDSSENIVFFGGAGVSTESKIPDFRSDRTGTERTDVSCKRTAGYYGS